MQNRESTSCGLGLLGSSESNQWLPGSGFGGKFSINGHEETFRGNKNFQYFNYGGGYRNGHLK